MRCLTALAIKKCKLIPWFDITLYWLNGHEFEQTLRDSEGQGSLACCSPWGHRESDMTEQLNNINTYIQTARIQIVIIPNAGEDMKKLDLSYVASGKVKIIQPFWKIV